MTQKNPFCSCGKCYQKGQCDPNWSLPTSSITGFTRKQCCNCLPKRICVHVYLYEEGEVASTGLVSTQVRLDCNAQSYSGILSDVTKLESITFSVYFVFNEYNQQCYIAFDSASLGYTGDTTLLIPMGGPYNDGTVRRQECTDFDWEFPAIVNAAGYYLDDAIIRVVSDDVVPIPRNCEDEASCYSDQICITYADSYGNETKVRVCVVDGEWTTEFYDEILDATIDVSIEIVNIDPYLGRMCGDAPTLKLTSTLDADRITDESVEAGCPDMTAEWLFYGGQRISVARNSRWFLNRFSDCGCICRCICVTILEDAVYATPPPRMMVGSACLQELMIEGCGTQYLHGWTITVVNSEDEYDTMDVSIWLHYDCVTQTTYLKTNVSSVLVAIACPDLVSPLTPMENSVNWSVTPPGEAQPYLMSVRCLSCIPCTLNALVATGCCPYNPTPARLTAEVTSTNEYCTNLLGQTGTLLWNGREFEAEWSGEIFGVLFILTCGGTCGTPWCLSDGCGPMIQQGEGSCDPFQLVFKGGGGCAACDEPATSEFTITITA